MLDGLRALYDPRLVRDFRLFSAEHGRLEEVFTQPAPSPDTKYPVDA
jgi:hypothetical protein